MNVVEPENPNDLTTEDGVRSLMKSSASEQQWNANADKVKSANGGQYPSFWYQSIVMSGVMAQTVSKF